MPASTATNLRSAAIVLRSLPPRLAAELVARLPRPQAERLQFQAANAAISEEERTTALREFSARHRAATARSQEKPVDRLTRSLQSSGQPFQFLHNVDLRTLANMLSAEQPQTIALVVSHLPPERGAQLMARLREEQRSAVTDRIATMCEPAPDAVRDVADVMAASILGLASHRRSA